MADSSLLEEVRANGSSPGHVALVMDGNGRWARRRGRRREAGHRAGLLALGRAVEAALASEVEMLTVFAFSDQNWARPTREVAALLGLLELHLVRAGPDLLRKGVSVRVVGDLPRIPPRLRGRLRRVVRETREGDRMWLNVALAYGGRSEIVRAARELAERTARGALLPSEIDENSFAEGLYTSGMPDPDLLIRTSGESRISNFLLWQSAYTELYFTPVLWPDFSEDDFFRAVLAYQHRERRFGKVFVP